MRSWRKVVRRNIAIDSALSCLSYGDTRSGCAVSSAGTNFGSSPLFFKGCLLVPSQKGLRHDGN